MSLRVNVRVCVASKPRKTASGKTVINQSVVVDLGDENAPEVLERVYFDEAQVLPPGPYTAALNLYSRNEVNEKGFTKRIGLWTINDLRKA